MMHLYLYEKNYNFSSNRISKMNDYFNVQNKFHIIYERKGQLLRDIKSSIISRRNLLSSIKGLCKSIRAMHDIGVLHLQVNSESISYMYNEINTNLDLYITDFERLSFRNSTDFIGLSFDKFTSPEMLVNMPLDEKADVWSLGCLTYYMLTGKELIPVSKKEEIVFIVSEISN